MKWTYNDGGRSKYFKASKVEDCVTRSVAIATGLDYKFIYDTIKSLVGYSPRGGIYQKDIKKVMARFGGEWTPARAHLRSSEMPRFGRFTVRLDKHITCVLDGEIQDIYDPSRDGKRIIYGYWQF